MRAFRTLQLKDDVILNFAFAGKAQRQSALSCQVANVSRQSTAISHVETCLRFARPAYSR